MSYQNKSWNLKDNFLFVWFMTEGPSPSMVGKVLQRAQNGVSFTPQNPAAYMLLYLLCRDKGDDIHFDQLVDHVEKRFKTVDRADAEKKVIAFLDEISTPSKNIIQQRPENRPSDPDPCSIYTAPADDDWPTGEFLKAGAAGKMKDTVYYSTGYVCICYRP